MKLGVITPLRNDPEKSFRDIKELGLESCQLNCWETELMTDENAEKVNDASQKYGIEVTAFWCGWSGPKVWDFYEGPHTLGLLPEEYRETRVKELKIGSDFAKKIGVTDVVTHVGFLPEVPTTTQYHKLIVTLKDVAGYMKDNDQYFLFETGQETPVTLLRTIEDVGTGNLGINLDPANLILYGKANPVDALDVFGKYVRGIHGKDGKYPTDGKNLGAETVIGEGKVNYPEFIKKLKSIGYDRSITIEREITGEEQKRDIIYARDYLRKLISE